MTHLVVMVMAMVMVSLLTGMVLVIDMVIKGFGAMGGGEWGVRSPSWKVFFRFK